MSVELKRRFIGTGNAACAMPEAVTIDPAKFQKWVQIIMQLLPIFLAAFSNPNPAPTPPPVQAPPAFKSPDDVFEYVEGIATSQGLSDNHKARLFASLEVLTHTIMC
jgi:hypothetical protein